ncbi:23S rRNA (guanosine(2251)-2'-O)-methyltransferase RlmB [Ichthyobacterium seriolicida]|uniref:RNA methyltransferase n=1 Tax=Ichthyobacterium seriolicida TaxID=242600 RepID=A0A1J1E2J0_9FLAO|nr:23S rRNA (guanosine(2251)-2'-O)-methyltransferase RlmB [Ichthyobacterium seriolicida]BAV94252.1 RNA methyltransferase [Ichthyobacterium seriolicida]
MNTEDRYISKAFGIHPIMECIKSGKKIIKIFIQKGLKGNNIEDLKEMIRINKIHCVYVPLQKLNSLTRKNHQGVFAFISPIDFFKIDDILPQIYERGDLPLLLILDRVTDVRNFGSIVRTAKCAGVDSIIIPDKGSALINEDAIKTSAGAIYDIPICREKYILNTIDYLYDSGVQVVGATEKTDKSLYEIDFSIPSAIVMGSEEDGISPAYLKKIKERASIPMEKGISSLNVSVACGVFLYEAVRQRTHILSKPTNTIPI